MSLTDLVADVERSEKTLVVRDADPETVESVVERFADRNVRVTTESTASGPPAYAVLSDGDRVLSATSLSELAPDGGTPRTPAFAAAPYRPILDELDETTFTSYDAGRMLAASREIEDRAWRTGGTLYAGFQRYSRLEPQLSVYEQLGSRPDLDVTAFGHPDAELSDHEDTFAVVSARTAEIRDVWFVAHDGGGDDDAKSALVAEEREPRRFYGFWTYDPATVESVFDHVNDAYLGGSETRRTTGG